MYHKTDWHRSSALEDIRDPNIDPVSGFNLRRIDAFLTKNVMDGSSTDSYFYKNTGKRQRKLIRKSGLAFDDQFAVRKFITWRRS
jgi:hypothetical protein